MESHESNISSERVNQMISYILYRLNHSKIVFFVKGLLFLNQLTL